MARIRIAAGILLAKLLRKRAREKVTRFFGRHYIQGWRHRDAEGQTWLTRFFDTCYRPEGDDYDEQYLIGAESEFLFYFKMPWHVFDSLVDDLQPMLDGARTYNTSGEHYRAPRPNRRLLSAREVVACSLLLLVQGWTPGVVAQHAGVSECTIRRVFLEFVLAINSYDLPGYTNVATYRALALAMYDVDVAGSVDGSEIPCVRFDKGLPPGIHPDFYYSAYYKNFGLKILCVISICGIVLSCHIDSIAIHDANLGWEGIPLPPPGARLLGDSAFAGMPAIIAVDPSNGGIANHGISTVRYKVEASFGHIKKTFRILRGHLEYSIPMCMAILQSIVRVYNYMRIPYATSLYNLHLTEE